LAEAYAACGRYAEAADVLLLITGNQVSRQSVEDAVRLLRTAPTKTNAPAALPKLAGELNFVYAHVGALERIMEFAERNLAIGWVGSTANYPMWTQERARLARPFAPHRQGRRFHRRLARFQSGRVIVTFSSPSRPFDFI